MIDTHCHLYSKDLVEDIDVVISDALALGIEKFFMPAIDSSHIADMLMLQQQYPGVCYSMAGLHPCSVNKSYKEEIEEVKNHLKNHNVSGIGETGLDFYWDKTFIEEQYNALDIHIDLALKNDLPLILHTRNATPETIEVVEKFRGKGLRGIFHCFGGTLAEANKIIDLGFYLGIGGVVTYKNAGLAEVIQQIDMKHLVLETDAPYLAPVPYRGKRNESKYLIPIVEKIALVKNISIQDVNDITTANAENIFRV